eukprot:622989-Rhodomonas_salina.1
MVNLDRDGAQRTAEREVRTGQRTGRSRGSRPKTSHRSHKCGQWEPKWRLTCCLTASRSCRTHTLVRQTLCQSRGLRKGIVE